MNGWQFETIEALTLIIESELKQPLCLDELSRKVGISKYHLHRIFKGITGKTLIGYVRRRRLSQSLLDLIHTNWSIAAIAAEYQFEHEQSYIRAFKRMFQVTPAQYRKAQYELEIEQKLDTSHLHPLTHGLLVEPRMCVKPRMIVQGMQQIIVHAENLEHQTTNQLAERFQTDCLPLLSNVVDDHVYIGLVLYSDCTQHHNNYLSGTEVSAADTSLPFPHYTMEPGEYAVFRYVGLHSPYSITYQALLEIYDYIDVWRKQTTYLQAKPFHFERVDLKACSKTYCEMDIYVPIIAL